MPANAGRSDCATCPTVTPSEPASARSRLTSSSGFCPLVERPTSTAPGTFFTIFITRVGEPVRGRARRGRAARTWICFRAPPNPLVNTDTFAPPIARHLVPEDLAELVLTDAAIRLRHLAHVHGA